LQMIQKEMNAIFYSNHLLQMKKEHIDGLVDDKFQPVRDSFRLTTMMKYTCFRQNFSDGWERGGAAFAVYHHGKLVVDLWGGYADESCNRRWNDDTITVLFSCTKSVTAICMAMLVDRGLCDYSDKVTQYWPEFGQHGKHDITIEMILSHKAGLPYFEHAITLADLTDGLRMATIIEKEKPKYEPGAKTVYHVLTFGWLIDQVREYVLYSENSSVCNI
uniref:Beta-lactamase domain-containing protein n=1 Tax=Angiostrongylus cantonensis TaxID=6313 RepID=A0A0K0DH67_ANGCA